jgi:regulator of extracellular matrix RemA (YlzA/DUF370 family)
MSNEKSEFLHIGGGNLINPMRLIAAVSPESAPIKRLITDARDKGSLIDATYGKRTKTVFIMDSGHIILSHINTARILGEKNVNDNYMDEEDAEKGANNE